MASHPSAKLFALYPSTMAPGTSAMSKPQSPRPEMSTDCRRIWAFTVTPRSAPGAQVPERKALPASFWFTRAPLSIFASAESS